ncbi:hypothetical protein [Anabaena sp. CCY 0017]|uniref:hypothetical protein n=1 Tax=Anabaena sp. CCY 0017 TaxID=3103866 RepID=UPI0039C7621C
MLIAESLDMGAGLFKLLLVIEHIWKPAPTHILHQALAIRNRGYTNKVRLRGLTEKQGFLTHLGGH